MKLLSCVRPSVTPWTTAYQVPLSMGFSRQEYWSGVPLRDQDSNLSPPHLEHKSLSHWTTKEVPSLCFFLGYKTSFYVLFLKHLKYNLYMKNVQILRVLFDEIWKMLTLLEPLSHSKNLFPFPQKVPCIFFQPIISPCQRLPLFFLLSP